MNNDKVISSLGTAILEAYKQSFLKTVLKYREAKLTADCATGKYRGRYNNILKTQRKTNSQCRIFI